jgi:hypothetical protein
MNRWVVIIVAPRRDDVEVIDGETCCVTTRVYRLLFLYVNWLEGYYHTRV